MAKPDTNVQVKLKGVRLSFPNLFEPQEQKSDKGGNQYSYNAVLLLDKTLHKDLIAEVIEAMTKARDAAWPGVAKKIPAERRCMRDGEPLDPDNPEAPRQPLYDGYGNAMYISAKRGLKKAKTMEEALAMANPVQLIGPRKNQEGKFPRLTEKDGLLYGGCFVNAIIKIYGYDGSSDGNPDRINASLEVVQFSRHGEPFGAKKVNADEEMDEDDTADDDIGGADTGAAASGGDAFDPLG